MCFGCVYRLTTMKYRKLRIAWSIGWGIACLLMIALWARSYWWFDTVYYVQSSLDYLEFGSVAGLVFVEDDDASREMGNVGPAPTQTSWFARRAADEPIEMPRLKLLFREFGNFSRPDYAVPYWFLALSPAALIAVPWFSYCYSLRTLLIGM